MKSNGQTFHSFLLIFSKHLTFNLYPIYTARWIHIGWIHYMFSGYYYFYPIYTARWIYIGWIHYMFSGYYYFYPIYTARLIHIGWIR